MQYGKNWRGFAVPLKRSIIVPMLLLVLCAMSCRSPKLGRPQSQVLPGNLVTERLVPVYLSPDSALMTALFECDSNNRVILKAYDELKSKGVETGLNFENGRLDYQAKVKPDTVYIPAKDSVIYVPQPVEVEVNRLTWWQETWIRIGKTLLSLLALWLGLKGIQKLLKRNKT